MVCAPASCSREAVERFVAPLFLAEGGPLRDFTYAAYRQTVNEAFGIDEATAELQEEPPAAPVPADVEGGVGVFLWVYREPVELAAALARILRV